MYKGHIHQPELAIELKVRDSSDLCLVWEFIPASLKRIFHFVFYVPATPQWNSS